MARPRKHDGVVYRRQGTQFLWIRYWEARASGAKNRLEPLIGRRRRKSYANGSRRVTTTSWRSSARERSSRSRGGPSCSGELLEPAAPCCKDV